MRRAASLVVGVAACVAACDLPLDDVPPTLPTQVRLVGGAAFSFSVERNGVVVGGSAKDARCPPLVVALRRDDDDGTKWLNLLDAQTAPPADDDVDVLVAGAADVDGNGDATVDLVDDAGVIHGHALVAVKDDREGFVDVDVSVVSGEFGDNDIAFVGACFDVDGSHVVGGGERFSGPDLLGTIAPIVFSAPAPTASGTNEAHVPVPFFATSQGLGVFVETERVGAFDVAVSVPGALQARFLGPTLPLRLRGAAVGTASRERITDNVKAHARLMGLPKAPPRWALAPMQWRNDLEVDLADDGSVTSSGTDMLGRDVDELTARRLPFSTVWIDAPWETGYNTFDVNELQLPGFDDAMQNLDDHGLHAIVWATEHLNTSDDSGQAFGMPAFASKARYEEFRDRGFLVVDDSGAPFTFPWGRGQGAFVDFTNDAACYAWALSMRPLLQRGIRGFKLDYGESMRPDVLGVVENNIPRFADGSTNQTMHTRYARLYHECYIRGLEAVHGDDWFIITRTGGIFDQKNGVAIWPGDIDPDFARFGDDVDGEAAVGGIPSGIGAYLSLAMSGYPLYGADIGGYRGGRVTPEAFSRWAEFSALSTIFQVGGGSNQAPWDADLDVVSAEFAASARLKMNLWPMFETWIAQASRGGDGTPVVVPLGVFMGADEDAWADKDAFVVGGVIAAYPVVVEGARDRAVRVPFGRWYGLDTENLGRAVAGKTTATLPAPLGTMPMLLRAGAVLVMDDESETVLPVSNTVDRTSLSLHRRVVVAPGDDAADDSSIAAGGLIVHQHSETAGDSCTTSVVISGAAGAVSVVFLDVAEVSVDGASIDGEEHGERVTRVDVDSGGEATVTFVRRLR